MLGWFHARGPKSRSLDGQGSPGAKSPEEAPRKGRRLVFVAITVVILAIAGIVALVVTSTPPSGTPTTASTYISTGADSIVGAAVQSNPAGFVVQSSKPSGAGSNVQRADWADLSSADGSEANVTVIVYPSVNASMSYYGRLVADVTGLPGYTVVSGDLASFQQYGRCYAYGEDVESFAVINGYCTKGNVFLQVHLDSGIAFSDLEGDLTTLMSALYQAAA